MDIKTQLIKRLFKNTQAYYRDLDDLNDGIIVAVHHCHHQINVKKALFKHANFISEDEFYLKHFNLIAPKTLKRLNIKIKKATQICKQNLKRD